MRVVSRPNQTNQKVISDTKNIKANPISLVGSNLHSMAGGLITAKTWENSKDRKLDTETKLKNKGLQIVETSCDESDSQLKGRYDDDKLELTSCANLAQYATF